MPETDPREIVDQSESKNGNGNGGQSRLSALKSKEILLPAAATAAAAAAAGLAAKKGPDLMKKLSGEASEEAEELGRKGAEGATKELKGNVGGGLAGKAASKLLGGGGGDGGGGGKGGKTRRLPIQRWTDVAVPVEQAYKAWTKYEEFPKFMHRVLEVKEEDDGIHWREKIWFSTREWTGEITDKRQNDRIAWKSIQGTQHSGVISFHRLDKNLTRVLVTVDFVPSGMIEKMASGMRFVKRAVQADLARFKAYVELGDAKELEYSAKPEEMEQHQGGDDKGDEPESSAEEGGEEKKDQEEGSANGDRDRESQRSEREKKRQERRESLTSS
jgi:uncharacterized membrane protein